MLLCFLQHSSVNLWASLNTARQRTPLFFIPEEIAADEQTVFGPLIEPKNRNPNQIKVNGKDKNTFKMAKDEINFFHQLARSVFEVNIIGASFDNGYSGSAFLVRNNIILTNHHVLYAQKDSATACGHFEIRFKLPSGSKEQQTSSCKEVLFCHEIEDFCFIQMNPISYQNKQYNLEDFFPVLKFNLPFFNQNSDFVRIGSKGDLGIEGKLFYSINNSFGFGLQGSSGVGLILTNGYKGKIRNCEKRKKEKSKRRCHRKNQKQYRSTLIHYATVFSGGSGSPLFDQEGTVIGLTREMSKAVHYGIQAQNFATPISAIYDILIEAGQIELAQLLN